MERAHTHTHKHVPVRNSRLTRLFHRHFVIYELNFAQIKPATIVDKLIAFYVDLCTPGRGAGQRNWWMQGIRTLEQQTERTSREIDIRSSLRQWDREHPQIHHELIFRYVCGALVSVCCTSLYNGLKRANYARGYDPYNRR